MTESTEPSAAAAVDAVETVTHRQAVGEEIFSGMQRDAAEGVAALRELVAADEEFDVATDAFRDSTQSREADRYAAAMKRRAAALAACRAVGRAR